MLIGIGITILWLFFEYLEFKQVYNYFKENNKKILKVKINNINLKSNNLKLKQANLQTILQESETKINNNNITLDKNIADNAALLLRYETQIQTLDLSSSLFLVTKSNQLSNQVPLSTISCSLNSIKN